MCLAVKVDGTKMKPYAVIPAKKSKKELTSIPEVTVEATPNGRINEFLSSDRINVWMKNKSFLHQTHACVGFV